MGERVDLHPTLFPGGIIATSTCVCLIRQQNVPLLTSADDIVLVDSSKGGKQQHQNLSINSITDAEDGNAWGVYCNYYGGVDSDLLLSHLATCVRKSQQLPTRPKVGLDLSVPDEFQQIYSLKGLASMFKNWFGAPESDIYVEPYVVGEYLRPIQDLADRGQRNQIVNMLH